uniref:Variant surface glycoprotein 1125.5104 n=1 Tax=Trypanosoma brucei TaxID=5691 RepID=A0A1J0RBV7_9TRYP|nr:variant surface glycoprotein 1125.5104 [Trypanosoma brucei]
MYHKMYNNFLVAAFVTTIAPMPQETAASKGANAQEYLALCGAWRIAKQAASMELPLPTTTDAYADILDFSMSVASDGWKALIDGTPTKKGWEKHKQELQMAVPSLNLEATWPMWETARVNTKDQKTIFNTEHKRGFTDADADLVREEINATTTIATELHKRLAAQPEANGAPIKHKIKTLAAEAKCGADGKFADTAGACKDTTNPDDTKASNCGATRAGQSIAIDIVCLCTAPSHDKCLSGASDYSTGVNDIQTSAIDALTKACPNTSQKLELDTEIERALTTVSEQIHNVAANGRVIGTAAGSSCTEHGDYCVDYSNYFSSTKDFHDIPWVTKLLEIADLYCQYKKQIEIKETTKRQIETLRDDVKRQYTIRPHRQPTASA